MLMSVKTVLTPPFCENGCVYLCDICAINMASAAAAVAAEEDEEGGAMFNMYPTGGTAHKPTIPVFTEVPPKIIKIKQVIVVKPLDELPPLKMKEGTIVQYPNE